LTLNPKDSTHRRHRRSDCSPEKAPQATSTPRAHGPGRRTHTYIYIYIYIYASIYLRTQTRTHTHLYPDGSEDSTHRLRRQFDYFPEKVPQATSTPRAHGPVRRTPPAHHRPPQFDCLQDATIQAARHASPPARPLLPLYQTGGGCVRFFTHTDIYGKLLLLVRLLRILLWLNQWEPNSSRAPQVNTG